MTRELVFLLALAVSLVTSLGGLGRYRRTAFDRTHENERRQRLADADAKDKEITAIRRCYEIKLCRTEREIDTLTRRVRELAARNASERR